MSDTMHLAVLAGTTREQRESIKVARYIAGLAQRHEGLEVTLVDPKDFTFSGDGNEPEGKDSRYTQIVERADAFFIVTPEYNHSFPGSLKRMLDSELRLYNRKPVAFAGVSNGNWGGVRAIESLVPVVRKMKLVAMSRDVYFPYVQDIFDETGQMKPEYVERYDGSASGLLDELLWFGQLLKAGRNQQSA